MKDKKIKEFKKDDCWDMATFYEIYEKNKEKYIRFTLKLDRKACRRNYLSWIISENKHPEVKLRDVLEWDIYYGIDTKIGDLCENYREFPPQEAFRIANEELVNPDSEGRYRLDLLHVDEDTPCGYYFD